MSKLIKGGPYSKPVKLEKYPPTEGPAQVKPESLGLTAKLPKK